MVAAASVAARVVAKAAAGREEATVAKEVHMVEVTRAEREGKAKVAVETAMATVARQEVREETVALAVPMAAAEQTAVESRLRIQDDIDP